MVGGSVLGQIWLNVPRFRVEIAVKLALATEAREVVCVFHVEGLLAMVIQLQIGFFCLLPRVISHPVLSTQVHVQYSQALFLASRESRPSERVVGSFGPRDANHILVFVHPLH